MAGPFVQLVLAQDAEAMSESKPCRSREYMLHLLDLRRLVSPCAKYHRKKRTHFSSQLHSKTPPVLSRCLDVQGPHAIELRTGTDVRYVMGRNPRGKHCIAGCGRWRNKTVVAMALEPRLEDHPAPSRIACSEIVTSWRDMGTACSHPAGVYRKRGRVGLELKIDLSARVALEVDRMR